jgi:hypothetical protein
MGPQINAHDSWLGRAAEESVARPKYGSGPAGSFFLLFIFSISFLDSNSNSKLSLGFPNSHLKYTSNKTFNMMHNFIHLIIYYLGLSLKGVLSIWSSNT